MQLSALASPQFRPRAGSDYHALPQVTAVIKDETPPWLLFIKLFFDGLDVTASTIVDTPAARRFRIGRRRRSGGLVPQVRVDWNDNQAHRQRDSFTWTYQGASYSTLGQPLHRVLRTSMRSVASIAATSPVPLKASTTKPATHELTSLGQQPGFAALSRAESAQRHREPR
jgi:hypothetical protein